MVILNKNQTAQADQHTIESEGIPSIELMERAARSFTNKFSSLFPNPQLVQVVCGMGNNGGDGLAIARLLHQSGYDVVVSVVNYAMSGSKDYLLNLERAKKQLEVRFVSEIDDLKLVDAVIIDAMLGSGLSRKLSGLLADVVEQINTTKCPVVAVDSPTGLFTETPNAELDVIIKASHTITFQTPKLAFLLAQNDVYVGEWYVVDIKLALDFLLSESVDFHYITSSFVRKRTEARPKHAHKGTFGSALLIAGSYGMTGAAVLAAKACLRSGVGKLTVHAVPSAYTILQVTVPEAMFTPAPDHDSGRINSFFYAETLTKFQAVAAGPGMGVDSNVRQTLNVLIEVCRELQKPLVLDADALNNLADSRLTLARLPPNTILTPHPGEFKRLVQKEWQHDYEKLELLKNFAAEFNVIVCLKGAHTAIAAPNRQVYFNSTGNPGMATAGSGDTLTGIILSFLAQGYEPLIAAILGVYEHGLAGDRAVAKRSQRAIIASDIIEEIR